jgi:hypothetical protein
MVSYWKKIVIGGEARGEEGQRGEEEEGETASHYTVPLPHSHSRLPMMVMGVVVMEVPVAVGRLAMAVAMAGR